MHKWHTLFSASQQNNSFRVNVLIEDLGDPNLTHNFTTFFLCSLNQWLCRFESQFLKLWNEVYKPLRVVVRLQSLISVMGSDITVRKTSWKVTIVEFQITTGHHPDSLIKRERLQTRKGSSFHLQILNVFSFSTSWLWLYTWLCHFPFPTKHVSDLSHLYAREDEASHKSTTRVKPLVIVLSNEESVIYHPGFCQVT